MNDYERYLVERDGPPDPTIVRLERLLATKRYRAKRPPRGRTSVSILAPIAAAAIVWATSAVCTSFTPDGAAPAERPVAPTSAPPLAHDAAPPPEPSPAPPAAPAEPVAATAPAPDAASPHRGPTVEMPPAALEEALVDG
ncbi:MAG: hypothetical protein ACF8XB_12330 [Planctomycetota bacterium JB042]